MTNENTLDALSPEEIALIRYFRQADQRGRESIAEHAQSTAEDWPRTESA